MNHNNKILTLSALGSVLLLSGPCPALAVNVTGTLIQTIITKSPPWPSSITSPDPSGLAYLDSTGRLLDCDGEVDEMPAFFTGDNLFEINLDGTLGPTHSTTNLSRTGYSNEPVGCAYDSANGDLFISDDDQKRVFQIRPGNNGDLFTADAPPSFSAPTVCGSSIDAEGVAYGGGTLFIIDGVGAEVWKVTPSQDGIFDGVGETCTHFDTSGWVTDPEGGEYDTDNPGHLFVVGKPATQVAYFTTAGTFVRTIDISAANAKKPAGLAAAPGSKGSNDPTPTIKNLYIVDRGVDNNSNSSENDGKIYEFSLPGTTPGTNQPPSVNAGVDQVIYQPATGNAGTNLDGTVTDDGPFTTAWSQVSGPGTVAFSDDPNSTDPADVRATFPEMGTYVLHLTANDGTLSGSDEVSIEVKPPLPLSTLYLTTGSSGTVSGISFGDEDILAYDTGTGTWSMYFDGGDVGLVGSGVDVDAIQRMADGSILLSFAADASITIPMQPNCSTPVAVSVDDSDILKFTPSSTGPNTTGCFEWYFDGSDVELTASAEDVDAIGFTTPDGKLLVSTTGNPTVTGAAGAADEDLLVFTPSISGASPACTSSTGGLGAETCGTWALYFDGSADDVGLSDTSENIDGASIDKNSGDIYLTTKGAFSVTGVTGDGNDIFICHPVPAVPAVPIIRCTYSLLADLGGAGGLGSNNIDGFDPGTSSGGDTTDPTVSMSAPTNGATVSGSIPVSADASDDVGVVGVQFKLDGINLGAEDTTAASTSPSHSITWNTGTTTNGSHTLTAVARDAAGHTTTSSSVSVMVNNAASDVTPPTVDIIAPTTGATVSGSIAVSADASDDVGVVGVQFKLDGINLGAEDTTAASTSPSHSITWNTGTTTNGSHTLTAEARDAAGHTTTSSAISVTVNNTASDVTPPTVDITAPTNGATVSGSIPVSADASDNIGVVKVQFWLDGNILLGEDTTAESTSPSHSMTWNTGTTGNGSHTLTAVAWDGAGNTATSIEVSVTVSNAAGGVTILESRVSGSTDDAEEVVASGVMDLKSSDLEMTQESAGTQIVGLRFNNLTIPKGATITKAYIQFTVDEANAEATSLTIQGQAADNATTFTATANDISSSTLRPKTTASVSWPLSGSISGWQTVGDALPAQQTPEIKTVIQEIVNRSGWASGNSLAVIITGTGKRVAIAYNGVAASAPLLHVEYQ